MIVYPPSTIAAMHLRLLKAISNCVVADEGVL
jgi:hypothetical protein